ncbi:hypothetical protein B0I37DRAFT_444419 [Chaetomium sp. MPI-CAGE-AT-0009]|nr:hypothetical protein B0I37DRAFT_444419 [Chaetomium sp. MPI-CAGE-AT-0009]
MADSPQPATPPVLAPNLEAQLTCSICTDLLHQPLTLLDCLHTFCGACLKEWFHFQAERVESAPGPPPPPSVPIFTCPSCRDGVRDTKHDARVFSLLDMFVALNPGRGKSAAEKAEMDARYRKGDRVMPRVRKVEERTEEERWADERERRMVEEVRAVSLREATERVAGSSSSSSGAAGGRGGGRRRSESRQRGRQTQDAVRQVEHQSSLRSLISTDGMDMRDIEREVEEFARQIQEEGLLDGLDLDNLDLENNDELSRKITEAYRRRHRERRRDSGRRSNASAHSHRSEISARPGSRTGEGSRPTSRHTRSRAPSVGSNEERARYPPSSSALLGVQEPTRRRRASSGGRSSTLPVVPTQAADVRDARVGSRAQTDLTARAGPADSHARRPSTGIETRGSSSPTSATAPVPRQQLPRYKEPLINCSSCHKEHIEYELHFNCYRCHNGDWNICLDCWRRRKGCLHWFGFGAAAWARWEKQNLSGPPAPPPHILTANRYLPPKQIPGGAEGRRVLTTENPFDRLQSGTFCSRCSAWTNDCYWLTTPTGNNNNTPPPTATQTATGTFHPLVSTPPCSACRIPIPQTDSRFHCYTCPPPPPPHANQAQPQNENAAPSSPAPPPASAGSDFCIPCYTKLVADGSIAPENGPAGWRRCLRGHRMVVVGYVPPAAGTGNGNGNGNGNGAGQQHQHSYMRRRVERDLVGGRRLRFEEAGAEPGVQVVSWLVEGGSAAGRRVERLFAEDVRVDTAGLVAGGSEARFVRTFPPDGGVGPKAVAGWGWTPAASGGEDELMFPRGAEVLEIEDLNGEWFHGFYMGRGGLFPAPYVRLLGRF